MPFSVVQNSWATLTSKVASWESYVLGDTEGLHPLTEGASEFATDTIKNALLVRFTEASVDAFTYEEADAEMKLHWRVLCLYERGINGGNRPADFDSDYDRTSTWLKLLREGKATVQGLVTHSTAAEGARGRGLVRYRGRRRVIDSDNTDYNSRNPRI